MDFTKTVFDHSLITSKFLNDLQDYLIEVASRPTMWAYDEQDDHLPNVGVSADVTLQRIQSIYGLPPKVGDVLVSTEAHKMCRVTATDGQFATVIGI